MTHIYNVSGMTCTGCQAKVQSLLSKVNGVKNVAIDLAKGEAMIDMDKHIATADLKTALVEYPKYKLSESPHSPSLLVLPPSPLERAGVRPDEASWIETYKPLLIIFGYILGSTILIEYINDGFVWMRWMNHFMAGFFLVFSFFKLLNLKGFAESYAMYDIVAKQWNGWGIVYSFVELALGLAYLTGFNQPITNAVTFVVMTVSIIGVLQSVLNKRKIKCACLGDVFNLPMSTITIIEDALMIGMSAVMLLKML